MTNTKFRKRALLSSVAMLLVALVALGSATFAWFVANPTVTASGLKLETSAAAGLAVASKSVKDIYASDVSSAFKQTTVLNAKGTTASYATDTASFNLQPAAPKNALESDFSLKFGSVKAAAATDKAAAAATFSEQAVYSENIYLRTTTTDAGAYADVKSVSVTITPTGTNAARAGIKVLLVAHQVADKTYRVAGADTDSSTTAINEIVGAWKVSDTSVTPNVVGNDSKLWSGNTTATDATRFADAPTDFYHASGATINLPQALVATTDTEGTYLTAYVYLDGENDGVYSSNVPNAVDLVNSISISISSNTAS